MLLELLENRYYYSKVREYNVNYRVDKLVRMVLPNRTDQMREKVNLYWDEALHIWRKQGQDAGTTLSVWHDGDTRLVVERVADANLCFVAPRPKNVGLPFFQGKHETADDMYKDNPFHTGVTYELAGTKNYVFHEYSLSKEHAMCGRFFIKLIQHIFKVRESSMYELNHAIPKMVNPMKLKQLFIQNFPMEEYVENGMRRLSDVDMLWNMIDLKMAMNTVGLEVGVIFYSPNYFVPSQVNPENDVNRHITRGGTYSILNFDKYFRPRYYDRYVFGVIHTQHWYFVTQQNSMIFHKDILRLIPKESVTYLSYGMEAIYLQLVSEKGNA
jgi:hypothetical protein